MTESNHATLVLESGDALDVRSFSVRDGMSELFRADIVAVTEDNDIDFDEVIGRRATFTLTTAFAEVSWEGVCARVEQLRAEPSGLARHGIIVVPRAWLLTQRKNYRVFQMQSELEIVRTILDEWNIPVDLRVDEGAHKPRKYRVQYAETDFAFISRMLEDAGISYVFELRESKSVMILDDAPHARPASKPVLPFHDAPSGDVEFVTEIGISQEVRPGALTIGDLDYRRPSDTQPSFSASGGLPQERSLELFDYEPGAFLYTTAPGGHTPVADDRGAARTDSEMAQKKTRARLLASRHGAHRLTLESNAIDLVPGTVLGVSGHPHRSLGEGKTWLVLREAISGRHDETWRAQVELVPTTQAHVPELRTPRPTVLGIESATVVGPEGEVIHTDEYGRVRVHFHWDRTGTRDDKAGCWIPSSQPWAGGGFGGINLPRIGQEVLVQFLGGDPDRPVIMGRVYTETQGPPYKLPRYKNVSGIRSETTPRLLSGAADGTGAATTDSILGSGRPLDPSALHDLVSQEGPFQAKSSNACAHHWRGNEITHDDTAGQEVQYIQAQRDLNVVVKNAWTSVVGNHRATRIGTDEKITIGNKQELNVGSDQTLHIGGKQETSVTKEIVTQTDSFSWHMAKSFMLLKSDRSIRLAVGESYVTITPDRIVVQANRIDLNPAPTADERAAAAEVAADNAREAAEQASRQEVEGRWYTSVMSNPSTPADRAYRELATQRMSQPGFQVSEDPSRRAGLLVDHPEPARQAAFDRYLQDQRQWQAARP